MATRDAGPGASPEAQLEFIRAYLRDRGLDSRIDVVLASQAGPPLSKSGDAESAPENDASTDDADGGDDWVDDDDEGPSKAPEGAGRVMVAARDFEPGDVIFHEPPLLHTSPRPPFKNNPYRSVPLPHDWQRLLLHYTHILGGPSEAKEFALGALAALSTDGVTSTLAQETDPDRLPYWRSGAKQWTERYRKNAKKAKSKPPPVSIDAIEHLIHVIETNCHSADKADGTQDDLGSDLGDAVEIEEEVGVYFAGSFCNHSCLPNATVILNPPDADAAAPDASSTAAGPHPTWLTLRCIAPIAKGESITISYTDESMLPAAHRQSRLTIRGFTCHCELCSSDDVMRAAQCTCTKDGQAFALPPKWLCAKCGKKLDAKAVAKLAKLEDGYLDLEDEKHDALFREAATKLAKNVAPVLKGRDQTRGAEPFVEFLVTSVQTPTPPLHCAHWLICTHVRDFVDSDSLDLSAEEVAAARLFLVSADLFIMKTWTAKHPRKPWQYAEDLLHDLDKLVEAADACGEPDYLSDIVHWARDLAQKQRDVLSPSQLV